MSRLLSPAALEGPSLRAERAATSAAFFANGLGIGAWAAAIPLFKLGFGLSDGALGIVLLGFAVGALISMPLTGVFAPKVGTAVATRVMALSYGVALVLPALAPNVPLLVVGSFLFGFANGGMDVSMNSHASGIEKRWGSAIMSSFHAAFSAGGLVGSSLGGYLSRYGAVSVLGGMAALGLVLIALSWRSLRHGEGVTLAAPHFTLPGLAAVPLCVAAMLCMLTEGAIGDWSAVYLITIAGAARGQAAAGYAAFSAMMVVGRLLGDRIIHALGRPMVVALGAGLAAAGLALITALPQPVPVMAGFALVGLGLSNLVPAVFSAASRLGSSPAVGLAMVATVGYAGFLMGPVVIGAIAQAAGLRFGMGLLVVSACSVILLARSVKAR